MLPLIWKPSIMTESLFCTTIEINLWQYFEVSALELIVGVFYLAFQAFTSKAEKMPTIIAITETLKEELEEETMNRLIFPLTMSESRKKYVNYYGEFHLEALKKDDSYDFGMAEVKSGVFELVGISKDKTPNAKQIKVLCPHHCMHELSATTNNTLICTECDPRLATNGGM